MIVRERPSGLRLFFVLRGSILKQIRWVLLANIAVALAVTWSHGTLFEYKLQVTTIPFTLMGLPLAIFLGFRNNACYDRYWEARKLWGDILLRSRNLARQLLSLVDAPRGDAEPDPRPRMIRRTIAFAHALKHHLRDTEDRDADVRHWLDDGEWQALARARNKPHALLMSMGQDLLACRRAGRVDSMLSASVDATLSGLSAAAAGCERIKSTPLPFPYTLLLHRTAYLYCFLLPFGLVDAMGLMTPVVVAIVAYTFFGLDALGDEIEEPFGLYANDLPLDAIVRTLEVDLREALGDEDLPPPLQPVDYCLM
ncbi:bestrophin family protein [Pelomonas sp. CA6]|uniref:bestrophin family protein n=1 Tax=Pelomonas sp. CA6 TaxID=2907999 RepID=UPI001F4A49A0|nr:bestrophin family protein [Pelomonas sp. CA6]MCH7342463.1 bestrophin family protein [Pelomonas sp. CA6]